MYKSQWVEVFFLDVYSCNKIFKISAKSEVSFFQILAIRWQYVYTKLKPYFSKNKTKNRHYFRKTWRFLIAYLSFIHKCFVTDLNASSEKVSTHFDFEFKFARSHARIMKCNGATLNLLPEFLIFWIYRWEDKFS